MNSSPWREKPFRAKNKPVPFVSLLAAQRIIRGVGIVTVLFFFVAALTPASNFLGKRMAMDPEVAPSGAIVVLGGGIMKGGELGDESMRRAIRGIELCKRGFAPLIVLSGKAGPDQPHPTEAEARAKIAEVAGIPRESILKEETANTTREESIRIAALLTERNIGRILLVTESLHMRRAKLLFERAGLAVLPAPSDDYSTAMKSPGQRLWLAMRIGMESAALVYYRVAGYL